MNKKKILVVEDDTFLRDIYKEILTDAGFETDTAIDGEEAETKIIKNHWDLILLDIILPKMSGIEVAKKINQQTPDKLKNIVFLTNLDKNETINEAAKLGRGYLIKSNLNPDEFLEKIKGYLL